jgi:hypothetical protein
MASSGMTMVSRGSMRCVILTNGLPSEIGASNLPVIWIIYVGDKQPSAKLHPLNLALLSFLGGLPSPKKEKVNR